MNKSEVDKSQENSVFLDLPDVSSLSSYFVPLMIEQGYSYSICETTEFVGHPLFPSIEINFFVIIRYTTTFSKRNQQLVDLLAALIRIIL